MPTANQIFQNNYTQPVDPAYIPRVVPSPFYPPENHTYSSISSRKSLSYQQLSAVYDEIVNQWCKERWLTFVDESTKTFLTLDSRSNGSITIQRAIDRHHLTTGNTSLRSLPECLLIRTKSKNETVFVPNSTLSLENLCAVHQCLRYQLMAIICHSNETNSKLMFYRSPQINSWFVYYDQPIPSHSHSSRLSDDEQDQLESFIQQAHSMDPFEFPSPLSALCNHPITYVYMPTKTNEKH